MSDLVRPILEYDFGGQKVAVYLTSLVIVAGSVLLAWLVDKYLKRRLGDWEGRSQTPLDDFLVRRIIPPLTYMIVILGLSLAKNNLRLPEVLSSWMDGLLLTAGLVVFFLLLIRLVKGLIEVLALAYGRKLELTAPPDLPDRKKQVERIKNQISEIVVMVLVGLAILTVLTNLGVNLHAVWASLGLGGLALALAIREPLSNIVGRMYIFSTGLFDQGHFIVFDKWAGTVTKISAFRTYVELFPDMAVVSIPNTQFVTGAVQNNYGRTKFMYKWDLLLPLTIKTATIQEVINRLQAMIASRPEVSPDRCWIYLDRLEPSAKVVRVWFQAGLPNWPTSLDYGSRILQDILNMFEEMGVELTALPQSAQAKTQI